MDTENTAEGRRVGEWKRFTGDYEKKFYEVLSGNSILQHFWPNAGRLNGVGGWHLRLGPKHNVQFRPCRCKTCEEYGLGAFDIPTTPRESP